jgi:hypothetical protein
MSFIKKSYNIFHWPHPFSFCQTPSLFLNEIMKNQVLNKMVCSIMESCFFIPPFSLASFRPSLELRTLRVTPVCRCIADVDSECIGK